jgi:hypothetical protein
MSGPKWGKVSPLAARGELALSKSAMRLYIVMCAYADGITRIARPGQDRLATYLGWVSANGVPDRRRVSRFMGELIDRGLVEIAGQHPLGKGRWVRKYLVFPFPDDASEGYASLDQDDASEPYTSLADLIRGDAYVLPDAMRTFLNGDAYTVVAPSDQSLDTPVLLHTSSARSPKSAASRAVREKPKTNDTPSEAKAKLDRYMQEQELSEEKTNAS